MSDFPYTDAQVRQFAETCEPEWTHRTPELSVRHARKYLGRLESEGITVTFPEPRYYTHASSGCSWDVIDRDGQGAGWVSHYSAQHPDAEGAARAEAERLNREADQ